MTLSLMVAVVCATAGLYAIRSAGTSGPSLFGPRIDPGGGLQRFYGVLGLWAAAATLVCPFLPHSLIPGIHETIGWVCLAMLAVLVPRLFYTFIMRQLSATARS